MKWQSLCIATCALALTACAHSPITSTVRIQASLREPCPNLTKPADGTGEEMFLWALLTVKAYRECQSRHQRLVEAVDEATTGQTR